MNIRNQLYKRIGPREARRLLARVFSSGSATKVLEDRYADFKEESGILDESAKESVMQTLVEELLKEHRKSETRA